MKTDLSEWQNQIDAGREANIHKASFIERRLFYLINGHRHCEGGDLHDEAIPAAISTILAVTIYKGMQ